VWPGRPITAHWGIPDPAAVEGSDVKQMLAFREAFRVLEVRIQLFLAITFNRHNRAELQRLAVEIGQAQHAEKSQTAS
jgi:arsenate reductase